MKKPKNPITFGEWKTEVNKHLEGICDHTNGLRDILLRAGDIDPKPTDPAELEEVRNRIALTFMELQNGRKQ